MQYKKIVVVGDPHILEAPETRRGVNSAENLTALVAHVNQHHPDADCCLFVGDLTDEGYSAEYAHFKTLIAPLVIPPVLMIGNHDMRDPFLDAFPTAPHDNNGFVQFTRNIGDRHRLIALDTLNGPPYGEMRHVGMLCPQRLAWLEQALAEAGDRAVILAMHHQPFRIGLPGMDTIRLWNGPEFLEIVGRYANIEMLLFGHNHRSISGLSHRLPFTCLTSLSPQTPLDFDSIDPSGGVAEPPSYAVLLLTDDGVLVHHEAFLTTAEPVSNWATRDPDLKARWQVLVNHMLPERAEQA